MEFQQTAFPGLFVIQFKRFEDERGNFTKTLHAGNFAEKGLGSDFKESYYSSSKKNVIRGMHFQLPPSDHFKMVYPVSGKVLDVILDLRKNSPTYLKFFSVELSLEKANGIYIPKGMAHGFATLSEEATLVYLTSTVYDPEKDTGVLWSSVSFNWPIDQPLLSKRDQQFIELKDFDSPF